ncbi:hypothetical protein BDZ91DRAFT_747475 [Kalaharituber pfeilii]|nr:hypothetical protein BDZ91DRAFT_747475 [Kalaharituber pfeilii]
MPRPFLQRKPPAARKSAAAAHTELEEANEISKNVPAPKEATSGKSKMSQLAAKITRVGKAGRGSTGNGGLLSGGSGVQETVSATTHNDEAVQAVEQRVTRGRKGQAEDPTPAHEQKNLVPKAEVEGEEKESTPLRRTTRGKGAKKASIIDPDVTPKAIVATKGNETLDMASTTDVPISAKKVSSKSRKVDTKGKGRAIEEPADEKSVHNFAVPPSSPPPIMGAASTESVTEQDNQSSTSSIYGDENLLPVIQSTPKASSANPQATPPRRQRADFSDDEGYTPPSSKRIIKPANLHLAPVRRRLWESSSPAPSLVQTELPNAVEAPSFDIYEDSSPAKSSTKPELSRLMDIDARGDGASANILRTPKKNPAGRPTKRTSSGGKKTPDGKIVEVDESGSDSDSSSVSSSSADEVEATVTDTKPKRQKRAASTKELNTKDLLEFVPRRRRTGKSRATRNKAPVNVVEDDFSVDLTSEQEEEIQRVTAKKKVIKASSAKGNKTATTTKVAKAATTKLKTSKATKAAGKVETPVKTRKNSLSEGQRSSSARRSASKTYSRPKSVDNASDSSLTPVPVDKENEISVEPSSELGTDELGISKEGRKQLKAIKKHFEVVDEWEMEFEDVANSSL